jgi:hypothetical protein
MSITKGKFPYETDLQVKSLSVSDNCGLSGITTFSGVVKLSGTLDSTLGNIQFIDGIQSKQGIPSITPISTKFFNYTLSNLSERDTIIDMRMTVANTVTIPADTILNFPVGTTIDILQTGAGQTTIQAGAGVVLNFTPGQKLRFQWSIATILKRDANTWLLFGDLTA